MTSKSFLTAHDVVAAGACRSAVVEWCATNQFYIGSVIEALSLSDAEEVPYIEKAARMRGYGDGYGYGYGDGDGNGYGNGYGDGNGNGI